MTGEMSNVVTTVRAVDFQGNIKEYDASHLDFGYRHSVFHDNHEVIGGGCYDVTTWRQKCY